MKKKETTLNDVITRMKLIQTINPDIEFYLESYPKPHFVMKDDIVKFGEKGGLNGSNKWRNSIYQTRS